MTGPNVSTAHIDYLERSYLDEAGPVALTDMQMATPKTGDLRLWEVQTVPGGDDPGPEQASSRDRMAALLGGLTGVGQSIGMAVVGDPKSVSIYLAAWPGADNEAATTGETVSLDGLLAGAYPGIELEAVDPSTLETHLAPLSSAALLTGSPDDRDDRDPGSHRRFRDVEAAVGLGIDRLIRSLAGERWAYVICGRPLAPSSIGSLSDAALNELRSVQNTKHRADAGAPIAAEYERVLQGMREKLTTGRTSGAWHTVGYLLTEDDPTRERAKAVATSVFGGPESRPDAVRAIDAAGGAAVAARFGLPTNTGPDAPGTFSYPYRYPTVLSSGEMAAMLHLPTREAAGFHIRPQPRFDVSPHVDESDDSAVDLGTILDEGRPTSQSYAVPTADLTRHALVVGTTGSGKTNTVFHVLRQLAAQGVPFLVIEPAKTEYRRLLDSELGDDLRVFTLGDEMTAPFRINPFEVRDGVSVQSHIDHLTALFNASFVMYAPMPYVLERCIHEVYEDRGWDLVTGTNRRGRHPRAQPTVTDLYEKIDPVVDSLGYEREVTQDVSAALKTRIDNLRIGSKGLMLDTHTSVPIGTLLEQPTVLELDAVGDDDEKAFLMGLVLFSLYEHYQATGQTDADGLGHVTVLEEAHRLLAAGAAPNDPEAADKAGKAVESFTNLLAEIRAYGEGTMVVDQIPAKLASSVVKNTNLKVVHRLLAADDRALVGGSMGADDDQTDWLGLSRVGEAAVFGGRDDNPILVDVPYRKVEAADGSPLEERIRTQARHARDTHSPEYTSYPWTAVDGTAVRRHRRAVWPLVEAPALEDSLTRCVHALLLGESRTAVAASVDALLAAATDVVPDGRHDDLLVPTVVIGIDRHFERLGSTFDVPYDAVEATKAAFATAVAKVHEDTVLGELSETERVDGSSDDHLTAFRKQYLDTFASETCPCSAYESISPDGKCPYHADVARLVERGAGDELTEALATADGDLWGRTAPVALGAAARVLPEDVPASERRRVALCVAVQATDRVDTIDDRLQAKLVKGLQSHFETVGETVIGDG